MPRLDFIIISVVLAIVAGGFVVPAVMMWGYEELEPWSKVPLIPVALLGLGSIVFWRRAFADKPLGASAPIGIGTLTRIERTGMLINDVHVYRLHLDVQTPDGQRFQGVLRETIPDFQVARMQPGTLMAVAYDPAKPGKVAIPSEKQQEEAARVLMYMRIQMGLTDPRTPEISANGTQTQGVVMARMPTGRMRHGHSELELTVRFTRTDGRMVERRKHVWLTPTYLGKVEPGAMVDIVYLPHDDTQFTIAVLTFDG